MKSFEEIEWVVKTSRVLASGATDERILGGAVESPPISGRQGARAATPPAPRTWASRRKFSIRLVAVVAVVIGLLIVLFPGEEGLVPASIIFADVQQAMEWQGGVHVMGVRRCTFPADGNQPEQVYSYRTEKWASDAGYIDVTCEQDGTPVLQVCYHFDSGTITMIYHFLKHYYRFQVPQAYRDRLRGIGPVGLMERLFQSGEATRLGPELVQGKEAAGFEVSDVAQRLDESVGPPWVRFFFLNLKESRACLWVDLKTRLPFHMQGDFWLEGCLFSDFVTMRLEETNDQWQWGAGIEEEAFFPEMPADYLRMKIPGTP